MATNPPVADPEADSFAGPDTEDPFDFVETPVEVRAETPYDPTMDPGNQRWDPKRYFGAQPKVTVIVPRSQSDILSDPQGDREITMPLSINGYRIEVPKGRAIRLPRDFAALFANCPGAVQGAIEDF